MRRLKVDMAEVASAMDSGGNFELKYYLDLETGQVELVTEDTRRMMEEIDYGAEDDGELEGGDRSPRIDQASLPEWQRDALAVARAVEEGYATRYITIPKTETSEAYEDLEDFIATVRDVRLQERLYRAISGRGAFRYFKDVLYDYPKELERWYVYRDKRELERVREWLESEDIEPIEY